MREPAVSVVIATYNWSSVLRYALQSVLAQTFTDFEVRVVGDGCTDDSADVVASFGDARLHWENLPQNTGGQALPNNRGVASAHGEWIAYLGHDDLWHPSHLERLVAAAQRQPADVLFSLAEILLPDGDRRVSGLFARGYGEDDFVVPSSLLHRRTLFAEVGGWRDYREIPEPPDIEWQQRAWRAGKTFRAVEALSVFKFTASLRKDSYLRRESREQSAFWQRLVAEPDLPQRELLEILRASLDQPGIRLRAPLAYGHAPPGWAVQLSRWVRGLEPEVTPTTLLPPEVRAAHLPFRFCGEPPVRVATGERFALEVAVRNTTDLTVSSRLPHPVHLAYRWLGADGNVWVADGLRSVLEPPLAAGEERTYVLGVRAPARAGAAILRVALVQEGARWLDEEVMGMPRDLAIEISAPL